MDADATQQDRLSEWPRKIEIGASGAIAFAGLNPFFVVTNRARKSWSWAFVRFIAALREELGMFSAPAFDEHFAFITNKNNAVLRIKRLIVRHFRGPLREHAAVVPMQFYGRQIAARGELIMDHGGHGDGFRKDRSRRCRDAFRRAQFQSSENRREIVNSHIAKTARTKIPPAGTAEWGVKGMARKL